VVPQQFLSSVALVFVAASLFEDVGHRPLCSHNLPMTSFIIWVVVWGNTHSFVKNTVPVEARGMACDNRADEEPSQSVSRSILFLPETPVLECCYGGSKHFPTRL
jgi:hypothetical protein